VSPATYKSINCQYKQFGLSDVKSITIHLLIVPRTILPCIGISKSRIALLLLPVLLIGTVSLSACGGDDDRPKDASEDRQFLEQELDEATQSRENLYPCYVDLVAVQKSNQAPSPDPEVIEIQMQEMPYRVSPSNIVLKQNRRYKLVIRAGNEWHSFRVVRLGMDYDIPPGGQIEAYLDALYTGVYTVENWRHMQSQLFKSTITVVPQGMSAASWDPLCVDFQVTSPPFETELSAPLVIEGSFGQPQSSDLTVDRIEAWSEGLRVGLATRDKFNQGEEHSEFLLSIPHLPPGSHSLLIQTILQNGKVAASTSMPITIVPDTPSGAILPGYQGSIDLPIEGGLLGLPVSVEGWVAIPGNDAGTGVGSVEIWMGPRESGRFLTEAIYGFYRPDIAEELGDLRFTASGFRAEVKDLPAGQSELYVYVRDRETGEYVSPRLRQPALKRTVDLAEGKLTDAAWPVALAAAPDGRLFFAELLTGNIRIWQDGAVLEQPFATLEDVSTHGESGLLGLALHPNFEQNPLIYAMYVVKDPETGLPSGQRVVRYRDANNVGQDYQVVLDNLPATTIVFHNGGRLEFGPDDKLYISLGDIEVQDLAQDPKHLAGSILRYNSDGSIPADNPTPGSPVFAIGLRNVFGLAFQPGTGSLYATDNGPGGFDEVNRIQAGGNYGWPLHMGETGAEGFSDPIAVFGIWEVSPTYGPTGAAFSPEHPELLLFCAYHVQALHALRLGGSEFDRVEEQMALSNNCVLDVEASDDGWLYYSSVTAIYRARLEDLLRLEQEGLQ
jgi:glucose/arabinose dehydrogenase